MMTAGEMGYTSAWIGHMMINSTVTIGITGNIATGKSVIRRMLANTGVFGIDADGLANRMLYPGGSAYQQVIAAFGPGIKSDQGHISNKKLGQIVFNDPEQLKLLEALVHPPVIDAIMKRIKSASRPVASIEAIKLLESGLGDYCDHIWVSHASYEHQMQRLLRLRGLNEDEASTRIKAQTPQLEKLSQADVIINTEASFKDTWLRTCNALSDTIQSIRNTAPLHIKISQDWSGRSANGLQAAQLEAAWEKLAGQDQASLYGSLGMEMVIIILKDEHIQAFMIWEDWNFTGTLKNVYPVNFVDTQPALVFQALEKYAHINQTEILLLDSNLVNAWGKLPEKFGYDQQQSDKITYPAWKIAAHKAAADDRLTIWHKVLAQPFEMEDALNN
jgi:dephospho-CoA kinase